MTDKPVTPSKITAGRLKALTESMQAAMDALGLCDWSVTVRYGAVDSQADVLCDRENRCALITVDPNWHAAPCALSIEGLMAHEATHIYLEDRFGAPILEQWGETAKESITSVFSPIVLRLMETQRRP